MLMSFASCLAFRRSRIASGRFASLFFLMLTKVMDPRTPINALVHRNISAWTGQGAQQGYLPREPDITMNTHVIHSL